ncbi:chalcone isomerase family protein [Thalassotalea agarivorans]|uniref:Chalcone isomerase-like n=1 Tax=Thalassotalea agarivorans TaxID=349064 RepID=A0A1H9Y496_THASX|nr:chalcone isomerase family protein [Thalassotalea agarivorans]SES63649.1 Chalcone isomerase-like [Thalassotalea agarivorans]
MRILSFCFLIIFSNLSWGTDNFKEVGSARFSYFFWDIYDSKLLTPTGSYNESEWPIQLQITYLRDIKAKALVESTQEQWQHLNVPSQNYQDYIPMLLTMWPDIKEGDSLTLTVNENGSMFHFNNEMIGQVQDQDFGPLFAAIWLSEGTSEPELRARLLGLSEK